LGPATAAAAAAAAAVAAAAAAAAAASRHLCDKELGDPNLLPKHQERSERTSMPSEGKGDPTHKAPSNGPPPTLNFCG
jgi:hypothetical protein